MSTSSTLKYEAEGVILLHALAGKFFIENSVLIGLEAFKGEIPNVLT